MSHEAIFLATCNACDTPCLQLVSQQKVAFQVPEKVEAVSTIRNATRQVAACEYFFRPKLHCKMQGQIASCDMAFNVDFHSAGAQKSTSWKSAFIRLMYTLIGFVTKNYKNCRTPGYFFLLIFKN